MKLRLRGSVVPRRKVSEVQREQMFELMAEYYDHISREAFLCDLAQKDDVILLTDDGGRVRGFSTMQDLAIHIDGRMHYGLFSGDTVVARECWGQRVLGRIFLRSLLARRARRPFSPYYWFLISKGYKTYLLMANNFVDHYPRYECATPSAEQAVLDGFARALYPEYYDTGCGVLRFNESQGQLRHGIAPVTEELRSRLPRVAFFERRNPGWARGDELACIARMTWTMPLYYSAKALWRSLGGVPRPTLPATGPRGSRGVVS